MTTHQLIPARPAVTAPPSFTPIRSGLLQRKCACGGAPGLDGECATCREQRRSMQRRVTSEAEPSAVPAIVYEVLRSPGQPLDPSTRAFMEPRFGHDFGRVRVHTDAKAEESTRAVNALAYTVGQHVVFGSGRYAPRTTAGNGLLTHELVHTIQQDATSPYLAGKFEMASDTDAAEREAHVASQAVLSNSTLPAFSHGGGSLLQRAPLGDFPARSKQKLLPRHSSTLPYREATELAKCIQIMGEGSRDYCRQEVLGETPTCANPGVSRTLDLQPVFLRTDAADASPTGTSWPGRLNEANAIWGKVGVTFNDLGSVTVDTPLKTGGDADIASVAALRSGAGVEVLIVDNDLAGSGGAVTLGPLAALCNPGKVVMSDRGTSNTLLAHELGHILGIQHPGVPPNPGDPGTIMVGTGSHSTANSTRNTMVNFNAILCPPATGSTCLNPDP